MNRARKRTAAQVKAVLRGTDLFEMLLDPILDAVVKAGAIETLPGGTALFEVGDPPDRVYVVLTGVIEETPGPDEEREGVPIRHFTPGEALGDLALLTGTPRVGAGRVPEHAEVFTLTREAFDFFVGDNPGYGIQLAKVFARRVEGFLSHLRRQETQKELSGTLAQFDLSSIFQAIVSTNQTGVLTLTDDTGRTAAELLINNGMVERARCGPLEGEDAFYEVVLLGADCEFRFRAELKPDADAISTVPLDASAMGLLMEAMRLKDELPALEERVPEAGVTCRRKGKKLRWEDEATEPIAREVFRHLREPKTVAELADWMSCSTFRLYEVLAKLIESGQVR